MNNRAAERIAAAIRRHGPIPFDRYLELALYGEGGFYASGGTAGRQGDFLTSPEVGPLFGVLMARAIDRCWHSLGRPDPFVVIEAGAGPGTLARSVLRAGPECAPSLRYVLVERSAHQRLHHGEHLRLDPPEDAFPARHDPEEPTIAVGPIVVSLGELPSLSVQGVVLANELLDNLPFAVLEHREGHWQEVHVGLEADRLCEVLTPAPLGYTELAQALAPDAGEGARIPVAVGAWAWLDAARGLLERGSVVAIDYAATTAELAARPDWLRTYAAHGRGHDPLAAPGTHDITGDVPIDQLQRVARPTRLVSQREFLAELGIDELVEQGRAIWRERAHLADLAALTARSRISEAEALCDPAGLGAFTVAIWDL